METSNLPDTEFETLVIRMLNELRGRIIQLPENFQTIVCVYFFIYMYIFTYNVYIYIKKPLKSTVRNKEYNN